MEEVPDFAREQNELLKQLVTILVKVYVGLSEKIHFESVVSL